jgi:hypothetical protein
LRTIGVSRNTNLNPEDSMATITSAQRMLAAREEIIARILKGAEM